MKKKLTSVLDHPLVKPDLDLYLSSANEDICVEVIISKAVGIIYEDEDLFNHYQSYPESIIERVRSEVNDRIIKQIQKIFDKEDDETSPQIDISSLKAEVVKLKTEVRKLT